MNEQRLLFFSLCHSTSTVFSIPQQVALARNEKSPFFKGKKTTNYFPALRVGLICAVSRDLQLKENTRLVPRNGSPARRPRLGWEGEYVQGVAL